MFLQKIKGRVNDEHCIEISRVIRYAWNLTAYQSDNFEQFFLRNYIFTFVCPYVAEVDMEGTLITSVLYFVSANNKPATLEDFAHTPALNLLQDLFDKAELPYMLIDGNDDSIKRLDQLYSLDLVGQFDRTNQTEVKNIVLSCFRRSYPRIEFISINLMRVEERTSRLGAPITRLYFFLEDSGDNVVDSLEIKAPAECFNVRENHHLHLQNLLSVRELTFCN